MSITQKHLELYFQNMPNNKDFFYKQTCCKLDDF